jgi:hypothetical protein
MENAARLVVIHKGLGPSVLLQIKKCLKSFACCVLNIDSDNDRQLTAMSKEVSKTIRKVGHPGSSYPSYSDVEPVPEGIYLIYLVYMTKQLSSESNR